ncbi:nitroreductase family protein [bacterium]|nr:nitroreductase family protein [bacterium]
MIKELIMQNRSYRRFYEDHLVDCDTLKELVDLARYSASASNMQPLRYILSCDPEKNSKIFPHLGWARFIENWDRPEEGERPSAYIVILRDREIGDSCGVDHGIAAQNILLGATEMGLGGCMFGSMKREPLRRDLNIPDQFEIVLVVAIGKPWEKVVLETVGSDGDIRYWRDENSVHHVPKRKLEDIIVK